MDCGLCHLGRFAAVYKRAYGESPSQTVARARQAIRLDDADTSSPEWPALQAKTQRSN
jgi:AraC-like DNA-binding protein